MCCSRLSDRWKSGRTWTQMEERQPILQKSSSRFSVVSALICALLRRLRPLLTLRVVSRGEQQASLRMTKELEQRHRISIDRRAQVAALGNWKPLCEKARDLAQLTGMTRLEQEVPAPASLDAIDGTRRGTDDQQLPFRSPNEPLEPCRRVQGKLRRRRLREPAEDDVGDPNVGRVQGLFTPRELFAHERVIVVSDGAAHGVMRRHARLNDDFPTLWSTPGAAGDLTEQLKRALRCTEIG